MEHIINKEDQLKSTGSKKLSTSGKVLLFATGGIGVGLSIVCASFVAPAFRRICLPYVPATTEQISNVFSLIPKNCGKKLLDIGSGDGRIVIEAAKRGLKADGVELNPWLVLYAKFDALRNGVYRNTRFYKQDLWKYNVSSYNYIVIFGVEQMMKDLETKLLKEVNCSSQVIACRFPLPHLKPSSTIEDGVNSVWMYDLNKDKKL